MSRLLSLLVAVLITTPSAQPAGLAGGWHSFENDAGRREYHLLLPKGGGRGRPMIVFLHGCGGVATEHLARAGLTRLALSKGIVVVSPQQIDQGCWDWANESHQHRGAGEPTILSGITRKVASRLGVDNARIYIGGLSAGAIMTMIMAASYPEIYAAIFSVAGCPYDTCTDATGIAAYQEMGKRARVVPGAFLQGTLDPLSNYALGRMAVMSWLGTNDLADDGAVNGSVQRTPSSREDHFPPTPPQPGRYPECDPASGPPDGPHLGCALGLDRFPYTVERYIDADGRPLIAFWTIHLMGHHFTEPAGPNIAPHVWAFLRRHRLR